MLMMAAWCGAIAWRPAISRRVSAAAVAPSVERRRHYDPVESNPIGLERELIPLFWNGGHFLQRRNPGGGGGEEEEEVEEKETEERRNGGRKEGTGGAKKKIRKVNYYRTFQSCTRRANDLPRSFPRNFSKYLSFILASCLLF